MHKKIVLKCTFKENSENRNFKIFFVPLSCLCFWRCRRQGDYFVFSNNIQKRQVHLSSKQLDLPHCQAVWELAVCRFNQAKDIRDTAYPAVLLQRKATLQRSPSLCVPCVMWSPFKISTKSTYFLNSSFPATTGCCAVCELCTWCYLNVWLRNHSTVVRFTL